MKAKSGKKKDRLRDMEELLTQAMEPGSRLFAYTENELVTGGAEGAKPDAKPLREVASVLQQIRDLRGNECENELKVVFAEAEQAEWGR